MSIVVGYFCVHAVFLPVNLKFVKLVTLVKQVVFTQGTVL
jgi:hypothetical protein